jgi:hypothetical protein
MANLGARSKEAGMPTVIKTMTPAHRQLRDLLEGLPPCRTTIIADMTNTLLYQSPDGTGYAEGDRRLHREFLARGGVLLVVTGDSRTVAHEQFLDRLGYVGGHLFILSGSGHEVEAVRREADQTRWQCLHLGSVIDRTLRRDLLFRLVACLEVEAGPRLEDWLSAAEVVLLSESGTRLDVSRAYAALPQTTYIEVVPNKVTCYFPSNGRATGVAARVLDRLASDDDLNRLAERAQAFVVRGPDFVDIVTSHKGRALDTFMNVANVPALRLAERTLLVMGDSVNDHLMFEHRGITCARRVLIYLGGDDPPAIKTDELTRFVHLYDAHVAGSRFVFETLLAEAR